MLSLKAGPTAVAKIGHRPGDGAPPGRALLLLGGFLLALLCATLLGGLSTFRH
jgi:hypothetical protein